MTELQRYLAEEIVEDHGDGIITRREAMRRLGLLGVTGAAATTLLAGVARAEDDKPRVSTSHSSGPHEQFVEWAPVATEATPAEHVRGAEAYRRTLRWFDRHVTRRGNHKRHG